MSGGNARLNPIVMCVPFPVVAAGTALNEIFYVTSLGGQLLSGRFANGATLSADDTNYGTFALKVGSNVGASLTSQVTGGTTVTANVGAILTAGTVANRQWARGTSTSLSTDKAFAGTGAATTATCFFTAEFIQGAFDPLT